MSRYIARAARAAIGRRFYSDLKAPTIYALSTRPGKAAIAVVRVSGPVCLSIFQQLGKSSVQPRDRTAKLVKLWDPKTQNTMLDQAIALFFKGPKSYTGEDLLELHLHGGNAVVQAVLKAIGSLHDPAQPVRYAEPGEFTMKAFHSGQLDLTQVEGVRDLIDAETEYQRQAAVQGVQGSGRHLYEQWRDQLLHQMALMSVLIDFVDDNVDIQAEENAILPNVISSVKDMLDSVRQHQRALSSSELLLQGITLNLMGPPNAGKSSLLNLLLNRDAAIVSEFAGTTRDVVEASMDIQGHKVIIGDTAGLRRIPSQEMTSADILEIEGIRRSLKRIKNSDIILVIVPVDQATSADALLETKNELDTIRKEQGKDQRLIIAVNKIDLLSDEEAINLRQTYARLFDVQPSSIINISCRSGYNLSQLLDKIGNAAKELTGTVDPKAHPVAASQRVRNLLENDLSAGLEGFLACAENGQVVEAMAELQYAIDGIGKITGQNITVDEVLGAVFSSFCIGK